MKESLGIVAFFAGISILAWITGDRSLARVGTIVTLALAGVIALIYVLVLVIGCFKKRPVSASSEAACPSSRTEECDSPTGYFSTPPFVTSCLVTLILLLIAGPSIYALRNKAVALPEPKNVLDLKISYQPGQQSPLMWSRSNDQRTLTFSFSDDTQALLFAVTLLNGIDACSGNAIELSLGKQKANDKKKVR